MIRSQTGNSSSETEAPDPQASDASTKTPIRRSWPRWILIGTVLVVLLPSMISLSGRASSVLSALNPQLSEITEFRSASLHWWSPIEVSDLIMRDATAERSDTDTDHILFRAESLRTVQPLWKLLLTGGEISMQVVRPQLNLAVVDNSTNLELTIDRIFPDSQNRNSPRRNIRLDLQSGTLCVRTLHGDHPDELRTVLTNLNAELSTDHTATSLPQVNLVATVGRPQETKLTEDVSAKRRGINPRIARTLDRIAADFPLHPFEPEDPESNSTDSNSQQRSLQFQIAASQDGADGQFIALTARHVQLSEFQPLLRRFFPNMECQGLVSCRVQSRLLGRALASGMAGRLQLHGNGLSLRHSDWTNGETLNIDQLVVSGAGAIADTGLILNDFHLQCPVATAAGSGQVRLKESDILESLQNRAKSGTGATDDAVAEARAATAGLVRINGRIDLAAIVSMLPGTLQLRNDMELNSAGIEFGIRVRQGIVAESDGKPHFHWQSSFASTSIKATRSDRPLEINTPIRIDALGQLTPDAVSLQRGRIFGDFGSLNLDTDQDGFLVQGTLNFQELWVHLGQLTELPAPGIRDVLNVKSRLRMDGECLHVSDSLIQSDELKLTCDSLTFNPSQSLTGRIDGAVLVEGRGAALRTLVSPWHSATWLSESTNCRIQFASDPRHHLLVQLEVIPNTVTPQKSGVTEPIPVSSGSTRGWEINEANVDLAIVVDAETARWKVERGRIQVAGVTADVSGTLQTVDGLLTADLVADTEYDLGVLSRQMIPDGSIQLRGGGRDKFRITGVPSILTARELSHFTVRNESRLHPIEIQGAVQWQGGSLWGLDLGPGRIDATLHDGFVRAQPVKCRISNGELVAIPQFDIRQQSLHLATGSRITDVQFTDALCREWLGYVSPILSDSTQVTGVASARVHQFDYLLHSPESSRIQAVLSIENVTASPGPAVQPLIQIVDTIRGRSRSVGRDLIFPSQDVNIQMREGQIQHDQMTMEIAGYRARTSGSVGWDRRVRMTLFVGLDRSSDSLNSQRALRIPIHGTIDRPGIDTSQLLQSLGTQKVEEKIDEELGRQLNKLFNRLK